MSRIGIDLSDCCNYLESSKKTERRKRLDELKLLLDSHISIEFLNRNSETKTGISWLSVFTSLHQCLRQEADSYRKEITTDKKKVLPATDKAVKACCGLLVLVVTKANAGQPLLPCHDLFSCILEVCEIADSNEIILKSIVGETYINLLFLALSSEKYWGEINFQTWKGLRTLCLNLIQNTSSERVKATIMSVINIILLHGGKLSPLIIKSKKLLSMFPDILKNLSHQRYTNVDINSLYVCHTICTQFGKEFRLSVCEFIDQILPFIMSLNDNRMSDVHFKELSAQVLLEMVAIRMTDKNWNQEAMSLLNFAEKELADISRHKLPYPQLPKIVVLAVKLVKQLHLEKGGSEEFEDPVAKRRKMTSFVGVILDNVTTFQQCPWPWLCYLDHLLEKAPEVLGDDDVSLFRYLTEALPSTTDPLTLQFLTRSSARLLNLCKTKNVITNDKYHQELQTALWSTVFRCISSQPLMEIGLLLAIDLIPDWSSQESMKILLELFLERKIPVSTTSQKTLLYLSSTGIIKSSRDRISLVQWCLSGDDYSADTVIRLLVKTKLPAPEKIFQTELCETETEYFLKITSLGYVHESSKSSPIEVENRVVQEDREVCEALLRYLVDRLSEVNSTSALLAFSSSLCALQGLLLKYNLSVSSKIQELLDKTLSGLFPRLEDELKTKGIDNMLPFLTSTSIFFNNLSKINKITNFEVLQNLASIMIDRLKQQYERIHALEMNEKPAIVPNIDVTSNNKEPRKENVEVIMIETVLNIAESLSDEEKLYLFVKILNFCSSKLNLSYKPGFRIVADFTRYIISSKIVTPILIKDIMKLNLKLLKRWYMCYNETMQILNLLSDTIEPVFLLDESNEVTPEIYRILSIFAKYISSKKYGPHILSKYVSLLAHVIKVDLHGKESIETGDGKLNPLLYFIEFLNNPFHEVRMKAADCLPMLFGSEISLRKKPEHQIAFTNALKAVDNLFIVKDGKTPDEVREEGLNRSCCALKVLLGLICSSYIWRRKALFHLFKIISSKKISQTLFSKVHHYLEKSLNLENVLPFLEHNLDYILWSWYDDYKDFQNFPYLFMNYESLQAFLKEYKAIVVTIFLENNDVNGFKSLCDVLDSTGLDIAKSCFPDMIACLLPKLGGSDLKHANEIHTFILNLIDQSILKKLLSSEIRKVLLAVYMKLNDLDHFQNLCGSSMSQLPSPTPLSISLEGIQVTLQYMQRTSPNPEQCLLVLLCNDYPNYIQFIIQYLVANISLASTTENRSLCFLQYISFCETLASELPNINKMAGFVIWHATHTLLNLLHSDLAVPASSFLFRFLEKCFLNHAKYVDYLLDSLYPTISSLSAVDSESGQIASRIKDLLVENKSMLPSFIAYLPLEETTANLEEELNIFIKRKSPDEPALDRLSIQLGMRRKELNVLYEKVKNTRCFLDDCSRSVIHKLISKLVTLATSPDTKIQNAAARCLGQIGPKNLNTLALQPESNSAPPPLAEKILSLLLPLIVHNDSEISEAASAAVTELLLTREGYAALGQLNGIEKTFLIPFYPVDPENTGSIQKSFNSVHLNWASCIRVLGSGSEGWAMWSGKSHSAWIRSVSSRLFAAFDRGILPLLSPLAAKETEIGEELLPYIIEIIIELAEEDPEGLKIVQSNLGYFFKKHFALRNSSEKIEDDTLIYVNRKSVRCMLSIVNFCRFKSAGLLESERLESLKLLKVDLLHVAYAAQFCRAYFTSLIYAELWVESVKSEFASSTFSGNKIPLDEVCKKFPEDGRILLNLLWEDYKELGEQDSIEGCVRLQLGESNARIRYFREMGLWQQLIAEAEVGGDQEALTQGLLMSGLFTVASHLNLGGWEAAWRLSQWETETQASGNDDFSSLHYSALKTALYLKDKENTLTFLDSARSVVLRDLAHASLEVASSVYIPLAKLQLINEVENWCEHGEVERDLPDSDWVHLEPILWQRGLLSCDPQLWLSSAKIARANKSHLIAQRFLLNAKKMEISKKLFDEVKVEEAQSHWDSGNLEIAVYILRTLLDKIDDPVLKAQCFLTYGTWMSETKSEGPKAIIEQYFEQATLLVDSKHSERLGAAECLAKFADSEYQRIHRYLLSPEFDMKKAQVELFRRHLQVIDSTPSQQKTMDEKKSAKIHTVNLEVDEAEIKAVHKEYLSFLRLAVREYLYSLQFEETTSDKMFRFVSLWLANKNTSLKKDLDTWLSWVPSYRFIPVFPQLAVRISPDEEPFSRTLKKLLYRCTKEHPHQCLWHLLALSNAEFDKNTDSDSPPQPRVIGATNILNDLEKSKTVGNIVIAMKELAMAYINLANITPSNVKQLEHKISKHEKLRVFRDIHYITCATMNSPIKKNADYTNIIGIVRFDDTYTLVGGINCPKKVKCLCTDGKKRIELVKGNDDPRQDALMQQVFSVLNTLLEGEKETSRRKLSVRTYKVVPLTQKSGVIEWCENTETIGGYLMHAHSRHRPHDISLAECRNRLQAVASRGPDEKLKAFLKICSELKPIMRHFFFERFPTPGEWYEKRLAYTRSIATNSMIGYMMGIGDRHVNNILIDKETAELIHIDFGIAFELARILPTPETVPFRLTRDIEDGMGITGVEGVFRRCCEETMKVLRKRSEPILTTLEMLLYDPLYSWSVKPKSTQSQQSIPDMSTEETNKLAERFLQRLKLKLEGREEGEASSVEGQVRILIQEAKDPRNLSRLYRGWQAFL